MFIVLDGGDFTGKSTVIQILSERLKKLDQDVITCNDPSTELPMSKALRKMLLEQDNKCHNAELFCFLAGRAELNEKVINPALQAGKIVLCDRYVSSTIAYQSFGRENPKVLDIVDNELCTLHSDYTFILSVNDDCKIKRMESRSGKMDNFDLLSNDFHKRVMSGYEWCAENPDKIKTDFVIKIDTSYKLPDQVVDEILNTLLHEIV